ncbi:PREDICTED: angiopoietin-like protein 8 isoform X2 [Chinchilla lanigera]|uniref:Angiopoietin like 8 n=1 Tax=Chinchilla lanigera TaxID=34839 RepID=A0A8C2V698_CHILA|nr:PREDICTED: angiopoietin-like protein 8 isoform X2 [Chinchilla lanigera]
MPALALCLLWVLATAARSAPVAPVGGREPARYEELTLLLHGVLQIAQDVNSAYTTTEERLTRARHGLDLSGRVLELLGLQVSQGRNATRELRTNLLEIQMDEDALQLQAEATAQGLAEAAWAQQALQDSVCRLQVQLRGARLRRARHAVETLKALADKQSRLMWVLKGHMHRQRQEMKAQQEWLQQLQERLHTAALPA